MTLCSYCGIHEADSSSIMGLCRKCHEAMIKRMADADRQERIARQKKFGTPNF